MKNDKIKCFQLPMPILYHYCSVESLLNILSSFQLFLSHSLYLNDHMETKWIRKVVTKCEKQFGIQFDHSSMFRIRKILACYKGEAYLACFSSLKDALSQWRAYADDGFGVSIGFDINKIKQKLNGNLRYSTVIYYEENQISEISNILVKYIPYKKYGLNETINGNYYHVDGEDRQSAYNIREYYNIQLVDILNNKQFKTQREINLASCIKELIVLSHSLKNSAFHEENEYRLCYLPSIFKPIDQRALPNVSIISELKHRHLERKVIPYHSLQFSENKNIIAEIILGPRFELDNYSIRSLLKKLGYEKVSITKSIASYR